MTRTGNFLTLILFLLLPAAPAMAKTTVTATVDRKQVSVGGTFSLQVTVSSDESVSVSPPSLPPIGNVQLLHSWTSSQSKSSVISSGHGIDFKTIRAKIFNYQYVTSGEGSVRIDPIQVEADGQTFTTEPIEIQVIAGAVPGQRQAQKPGQSRPGRPTPPPREPQDPIDQLEERFNQLLNRQFGGLPGADGFMTEPRNAKEAFFILAEVDKTEAYKGEQIVASWYLYTRGRVRDIDTLKYPSLKGFWKEDIQISTHLNFEQDVVNGVPYNRALLASYALFPIDEGKQMIDPYKAKSTIVGGFGFGKGFQATKSSDNIPILVKPLPTEGRPAGFTGAVGQFQMMVDAPNKSILAHQPFALKIRFEGRGNAKLIDLPELPIGDDLEIYDIRNEATFFKNGQSFKEFEVLLIPAAPGDITIGALKSSYFDTQKGEYVDLSSDPIHLTVLPGSKAESIGEERLKSAAKKKSLPAIAGEWDPSYKAGSSKLYVWIFLFVLGILVLATKAVIDSGLFNKKPSLEEIIKLRFERVEKLLAQKQIRKLGIEATNTVYQVLGEISGEGGSSEQINRMLAKTPPSVRREIEAPLSKLMDYFGVLGFGPLSYVKDFKDHKELKKKVKELKKLLLRACELSKGSVDVES